SLLAEPFAALLANGRALRAGLSRPRREARERLDRGAALDLRGVTLGRSAGVILERAARAGRSPRSARGTDTTRARASGSRTRRTLCRSKRSGSKGARARLRARG